MKLDKKRKNRMINIDMSMTIYRPVRQVFDFMSTPENDFQWQYGTLATARLSEGIGSLGPFFRSIGHLLGRRNLSTFEVTEYELNSKYGFRSLSGPLPSQTSYTFEMAEGGTRINVSTRMRAVSIFHMNERMLEKKIKIQLKENLTMLKGLLEGKVSSLTATSPAA
jgi:Polyketide cyclase / dehydrase and lipid transport